MGSYLLHRTGVIVHHHHDVVILVVRIRQLHRVEVCRVEPLIRRRRCDLSPGWSLLSTLKQQQRKKKSARKKVANRNARVRHGATENGP
jgi:hypothetical protein